MRVTIVRPLSSPGRRDPVSFIPATIAPHLIAACPIATVCDRAESASGDTLLTPRPPILFGREACVHALHGHRSAMRSESVRDPTAAAHQNHSDAGDHCRGCFAVRA